MSEYDFSTLNDKEFEVLCADLLSTVHGHRFERFKPGKDAGVDGRYFRSDGTEVILQCKHWLATPLERLVAYLEKVERPKIEKLAPTRYILAVSHQLSRTDKAKIRGVLDPYVQREDDVLGREDLNDILARDSRIERRHYKLWIRSTAVLQYMLNKAIHDRSAFSLEEIVSEAKLYVPTQLHGAAIEKLEQLGTVIVTGAPGIGKSTLANHMVLHYVEKGFSLIKIAEDIREAEGAYGAGERQIFYFDDFLGRNYLEALSGHEGSQIMQFIRRISHDKSKRLVVTSRTTILNQGKALIDIFAQDNIHRNELEIRIESLQELDKAKILYNHIWHSGLGVEYVDEIYAERRYRAVISHRNFNPRLIRFITDANSISDYAADQYWGYAKELLENPAQVWQHPFEAQLDDFGRSIVLLVTLNRRAIPQAELAEAYSRFVARPECSGFSGRRDFLLTLRHLVGSLLNRTATSASNTASAKLDLFNPSIGDYVLHRYSTDLPLLRAGVTSLRSANSIETLSGMISSDLLSQAEAVELAAQVVLSAQASAFVGYTADHLAATALFILENGSSRADISTLLHTAVSFILSTDPPFLFLDAAKVIEWAISSVDCDIAELETWVASACAKTPYPDEFQALERILQALGEEATARVAPALDDAKVDYITSHARDEFDASSVFDGASPEDLQPAVLALEILTRKKFEQFGINPTSESIQSVIDAYDIDTQAESFFADHEPDDDWREYPRADYTDQIDDLFERS